MSSESERVMRNVGLESRYDVEGLRETLQTAASVVALTGAGISAESGIPTFRGVDGLWRNYSPERLATPEAFKRDPRLVWEWYNWRRTIIRQAEPNRAHLALAELERRQAARKPAKEGSDAGPGEPCGGAKHSRREPFTLITQNVDGLHERAGSLNTIKLHGDIWQLRCMGCDASVRNEEAPLKELPPLCSCGACFRPGVVWFGEPLPSAAWEEALKASAVAQVFLLIGTSALVYPAAGLAEVAHDAGARLAVINPEPTPLDSLADWVLRGSSGEVLPRLL